MSFPIQQYNSHQFQMNNENLSFQRLVNNPSESQNERIRLCIQTSRENRKFMCPGDPNDSICNQRFYVIIRKIERKDRNALPRQLHFQRFSEAQFYRRMLDFGFTELFGRVFPQPLFSKIIMQTVRECLQNFDKIQVQIIENENYNYKNYEYYQKKKAKKEEMDISQITFLHQIKQQEIYQYQKSQDQQISKKTKKAQQVKYAEEQYFINRKNSQIDKTYTEEEGILKNKKDDSDENDKNIVSDDSSMKFQSNFSAKQPTYKSDRIVDPQKIKEVSQYSAQNDRQDSKFEQKVEKNEQKNQQKQESRQEQKWDQRQEQRMDPKQELKMEQKHELKQDQKQENRLEMQNEQKNEQKPQQIQDLQIEQKFDVKTELKQDQKQDAKFKQDIENEQNHNSQNEQKPMPQKIKNQGQIYKKLEENQKKQSLKKKEPKPSTPKMNYVSTLTNPNTPQQKHLPTPIQKQPFTKPIISVQDQKTKYNNQNKPSSQFQTQLSSDSDSEDNKKSKNTQNSYQEIHKKKKLMKEEKKQKKNRTDSICIENLLDHTDEEKKPEIQNRKDSFIKCNDSDSSQESKIYLTGFKNNKKLTGNLFKKLNKI